MNRVLLLGMLAAIVVLCGVGCSSGDNQTVADGDLEVLADGDDGTDVAEEASDDDLTEAEDSAAEEVPEEEQTTCVGWDDSAPSTGFAEYCGVSDPQGTGSEVTYSSSCDGGSLGWIGYEQAGDLMAVKVRVDKPFWLKTITARFINSGLGKLHVMGDYGRSNPDESIDLTAPLDVVIDESNNRQWVTFDISDRHLYIHPRDFFYLVYEHLAANPRLALEGACATTPGLECTFKIQHYIDQWQAQGSAFVWGGIDSSNGFSMKAGGEYLCEHSGSFYFSDVTTDALGEHYSHGRTAWVDLDQDGWVDAITHSVGNQADCNNARVWRNNGDGTFTDMTANSGVNGLCSNFMVAADVNNDGKVDLFAGVNSELNDSGVPTDPNHDDVILMGNGDFTFTVKANSGVAGADPTPAGAFADYDRDGLVDLFYGNWLKKYPYSPAMKDRLFKGNGDGTFTETTDSAGMGDQGIENQPCYGAIWGDYNNDGYPDLLVSNYGYGPNFLWKNLGNGTFEEKGVDTGVSYDDINNGFYITGGNTFGADFGDVNNDGNLDVYLSEIAHPRYQPWSDPSRLMLNGGPFTGYVFYDHTRDLGIFYDEGEIEPTFVDFDNDGDLDLFVSVLYTGHYARLYRQESNGAFVDITAEAGLTIHDSQNNSWADYDRDGDMDLLVGQRSGGAYMHLYRNDLDNGNHYIEVKLKGVQSNTMAIGARVEVTTCDRTQIREVTGGRGHAGSQKSFWQHFGLGQNSKVDHITVRWPSGLVQTVNAPEVDRFITITEGNDTPVVEEAGAAR